MIFSFTFFVERAEIRGNSLTNTALHLFFLYAAADLVTEVVKVIVGATFLRGASSSCGALRRRRRRET